MFRQTLGSTDVFDPCNLIEELFVLSRKRVVDLFFDLEYKLVGGIFRSQSGRRGKKAAAQVSGGKDGYSHRSWAQNHVISIALDRMDEPTATGFTHGAWLLNQREAH